MISIYILYIFYISLCRRYLAQCDGAAPRDVEGRTPLQLSVLRRQLPCAVRLLEATRNIFHNELKMK